MSALHNTLQVKHHELHAHSSAADTSTVRQPLPSSKWPFKQAITTRLSPIHGDIVLSFLATRNPQPQMHMQMTSAGEWDGFHRQMNRGQQGGGRKEGGDRGRDAGRSEITKARSPGSSWKQRRHKNTHKSPRKKSIGLAARGVLPLFWLEEVRYMGRCYELKEEALQGRTSPPWRENFLLGRVSKRSQLA